MIGNKTSSSALNKDTRFVTEQLKLLQGPGLNGLYQTATPFSWEYDEPSGTATYALREDYTLYIQKYPLKDPGIFPLKPEYYKLLDMLICKLAENKESRQVELPLEKYLHLAGYAVTETNKNAVRPRLRESVALLGALSADWTEENGRYYHKNIKFFDEIAYRNSRVYACFSDKMALYLRHGCSAMSLPLPLLAIDGKLAHSYPLGRRCLVHNAANKGREWQPIRIGNLLAVCPRIPRPDPGEKWPPSILDKKVIVPFTASMNALVDSGVLTWKFREPVCRSDYEGFINSIVEFRVPTGEKHMAPVENNSKCIWSPADTKWLLGCR